MNKLKIGIVSSFLTGAILLNWWYVNSKKISEDINKLTNNISNNVKSIIKEDNNNIDNIGINIWDIEKLIWEKEVTTILNLEENTKEIINNIIVNSNEWPERNSYLYLSHLLKEQWLSEETKEIIDIWIEKYLLWKTFYINKRNIVFDRDFIDNNKDIFYHNITEFLMFLLELESNWWYINAQNPISSAKWPLQWLDWFKWDKKFKTYNREDWIYSPFETALRRSDMFYNNWKFTNFKTDNTPIYIKEAWTNNWKLELDTFSPDKQIDLWFIDLLMRWKKSQWYLAWIMLWNYYFAKVTYKYIHHTEPNKSLIVKIQEWLNNIDFRTL